MSRKRSLEIDEDLRFQEKEWRFQRVGLVVLCLFVAASALGVTGMGGPLSRGEAGDRNGPLWVEYQRFVRRSAIATMKVHLRVAPGDVRFWISQDYFAHITVNSMVPEPQLVAIENGRQVYAFHAVTSDATITLEVEHETFGRLEAGIGLVDGPSTRFHQLSLF